VPARLKKEIETEKWIVWAPGLMNIIVSSQTKLKNTREKKKGVFLTRGETKKAHHHHHQKQNTNNNNTFNKCAERKGTLDEETTKRTR